MRFAEVVRMRKIKSYAMGLVLWICLLVVESDVLEAGLCSVCCKNNAAFNAVISEEFAY